MESVRVEKIKEVFLTNEREKTLQSNYFFWLVLRKVGTLATNSILDNGIKCRSEEMSFKGHQYQMLLRPTFHSTAP